MFSPKTFVVLLSISLSVFAAPITLTRRQVPQEHSHEQFLIAVKASLNLNNPAGIQDPVFGLLGAAAASQGAGTIADPDCLQQATADQAFTNAKAAGDVAGQVSALIYRALERNTLGVGVTSPACTSIQAVNPEIAAIKQHQDAASPGAAALNKEITLELARQIAAVGGDPLDALKSGTFAPGDVNDPTAAGNSCNTLDDPVGCIFTQNLLVEDASAQEIAAAVAGASPPAATGTAGAPPPAATDADPTCTVPETVIVTITAAPTPTAAPAAPTAPAAAGNLQKFTGALGGFVAPAVVKGGRGFQVEGSDSFLNVGSALNRSCDIHHNQCANSANSQRGNFTVGDCDVQNTQCKQANAL